MKNEKREFPRYTTPVQLIIYMKDDIAKLNKIDLISKNISASGAFVDANTDLVIDSELNVNIRILENELLTKDKKIKEINATGVVVRNNRTGVAMHFNELIKFNY